MTHPAIQALRLSPSQLARRITARAEEAMRRLPRRSPEIWADVEALQLVQLQMHATMALGRVLRAGRRS